LSSDDFFQRHRTSKKVFVRTRSLPFLVVFLFLINLIKDSLQTELDNFFKTWLHLELPFNKVTKSAFSQARKKLSHKAFIELNKDQVDYFYRHCNYNKWQGFRLVAIDGSTCRLPNSCKIVKEFGISDTSETGVPIILARLSQAYDMLNHITIDAMLSNYHTSEHELAKGHVDCLVKGDLALFDRNYASFWLFSLLLYKKVHFCARLKIGSWKIARQLVASGNKEIISEIYPSKASKKKCKELGLPCKPLKLRFIAIVLDTGEIEVLVTDLMNAHKYPHEIFKELYHMRWFVEESYKQMKSRTEIENFSGKSPLAVRQDFYAKLFTANLTAIIAFPVHQKIGQQTKHRQKTYQLNWSQAISKIKNSVVLLFIRGIEKITAYIEQLLNLFITNIEIVRQGRKNERNFRKSKRIYPMPYKTPL
jgi:hypothetical protein